jgi:tetratricopeptide (TPR) repeat protein
VLSTPEETLPTQPQVVRFRLAILVYLVTVAVLQIGLLSHGYKSYKVAVLVLLEGLAFLLYLRVLRRIRTSTYRLARQGEFERALRLNRFWAWFPGYGTSQEGLILLEAGRYEDAMAFLQPRAFAPSGAPKFRSVAIYIYLIALENSGRSAEAQALLEDAIRAAPDRVSFKVALATCLLAQEKDASEACSLLQEAIAADSGSQAYGPRSDRAKRKARYAWALGLAGQSADADLKIKEALAEARSLKPDDEAGVHYFVGEAWRVMGETSRARAEFDQAIAASVGGNIAINAKKGLAKLDIQPTAVLD